MQGSVRHTLIALTFLAAFEYAVYFYENPHFFQGDTTYWFQQRLTSFGEFFRSFLMLDPGGWYRPLTGRTVPSVVFPLAGFHAEISRSVLFLLLVANTAAVYHLAQRVTRDAMAAAVACVLFATNTANAYTTYDVAFVPELLYTLLYIASALAYWRYLESGSRAAWIGSILLFGGSLCSKESAVTLPLMLPAIAWYSGKRFSQGLRAALPHAVVLAIYLIVVAGYLGGAAPALSALNPVGENLQPGDYYLLPGLNVLTNVSTAALWAFNIPGGMFGETRFVSEQVTGILVLMALIQVVLIVLAARSRFRRQILMGLAWFWIALLPALLLVGHFLPYYLFLPVVGSSIAIACGWAWLFDALSARRRSVAHVALASLLAVVVVLHIRTARADARNSVILGWSSRIAETSVDDVRRLFPNLAGGSTIYILDEEMPDLSYHQGAGSVFELALGVSGLRVLYATMDPPPAPSSERLIVLEYRDGHLQPVPGLPSGLPCSVALSKAAVSLGDDYELRITQLPNTAVTIAYRFNDGLSETFEASLDPDGSTRFQTSAATATGVYEFVGVRPAGEPGWRRCRGTIQVSD